MTAPPGNTPWVQDGGVPSPIFLQYINSLDALTQALNSFTQSLNSLTFGHGQCRLAYTNATTLTLAPYSGCLLRIGGVIYQIPSGGVTISNAGLLASTVYYVYAYVNSGVMTLELSTTGHATSTTAGNVGVEIKSGDNSRTLVGMIRTNGSSQFVSTSTNNYVASWFNRQGRLQQGSSFSGVTATSTGSWVELSTAARVDGVYWADETVIVHHDMEMEMNTAGDVVYASVGIDFPTSVGIAQIFYEAYAANTLNMQCPSAPVFVTEGYHFFTSCGLVSGGTGTYFLSGLFLSTRG